MLIGVVLEALALAGLLVRRRYVYCYAFGGYLVAVLVTDSLIAFWTQSFYNKRFWLLKEATINLLMLAVALELTYRSFRAFPGARVTARRVFVLVTMLTLAAAVSVPTNGLDPSGLPEFEVFVHKLYPRLLSGAIWLFTGIAGLILYYRIPVAWFQKAILVGFVPYLLVFTFGLNLLDAYGREVRSKVNYLDSSAFILLLVYWVYATWYPVTEPAQPAPPMTGPELDLTRSGHENRPATRPT